MSDFVMKHKHQEKKIMRKLAKIQNQIIDVSSAVVFSRKIVMIGQNV